MCKLQETEKEQVKEKYSSKENLKGKTGSIITHRAKGGTAADKNANNLHLDGQTDCQQDEERQW